MIDIWDGEIPGYNPDISDVAPGLEPYIVDNNKLKGVILICPGGGYDHRADHEGRPVAEWLNSLGISAFVLYYRVSPYRYPYPVLDAKRAVRYIRYRCKEWNINPKKICIMGFSAGGHLSSVIGTTFDYGNIDSKDPVERESCRPDGMILSYPVISFKEYAHQGSIENLLGPEPEQELLNNLSSEKNVSKNTPRTFIWHTANDNSVPVEDTILLSKVLSKHNIPFETHIFPEGRHGLGMADGVPEVGIWKRLCATWLKSNKFM
ncbi:MAG: alpha/beta hydrolase [Firmicutes bacterium]|nr:alpha/beta hydrolase [Bacillota bacterium]